MDDEPKIPEIPILNIDLNETEKSTKKYIDELRRGKEQIDNFASSLKNKSGALKDSKQFLDSVVSSGKNFKEVISGFGVGLEPIKEIFSNIGDSAQGFFNIIVDNFGSIASIGTDTINSLVNPFKQVDLSIIHKDLPKIRDRLDEFVQIQNASRIGFTRWTTAIEGSDKAILSANQAAEEYPNALNKMAAAHTMSGKTLHEMMSSMQGLPIVMDQSARVAGDVVKAQNDMIDTLGKLATASKAFGMSEAEATSRAKIGYMEFNQNVEETIKSLATMSAASRVTGVDRKIADDQIVAASKSLSIFGQQSDAAANTWTTFTSALKDDIPIKQVGELVNEVTSNMAKMSVQNRAFISMMSGMTQGRSAIGGALQLEFSMRSPDGMEKHLQALTSTLSQFAGGKVITLEEAATNPQLEIQFQMQREMLGKITNISDTQAQNRVLEVLQKVQEGGLSQVEGSKELKSLMDKGGNVQERQLNVLDQILNVLKSMTSEMLSPGKQLSQTADAILGRDVFGSEVGVGMRGTRESIRAVGDGKITDNKEFLDSFSKMFVGTIDRIDRGVEKLDLLNEVPRVIGEIRKSLGGISEENVISVENPNDPLHSGSLDMKPIVVELGSEFNKSTDEIRKDILDLYKRPVSEQNIVFGGMELKAPELGELKAPELGELKAPELGELKAPELGELKAPELVNFDFPVFNPNDYLEKNPTLTLPGMASREESGVSLESIGAKDSGLKTKKYDIDIKVNVGGKSEDEDFDEFVKEELENLKIRMVKFFDGDNVGF